MPHFGLIKEGHTLHDELVMRAKLHVRGSRKRLDRGQVADAIAALFDAFVSALQARAIEIGLDEKTDDEYDFEDEEYLFSRLSEKGYFSSFEPDDFRRFESLLERAFRGDLESKPEEEFLEKIYQALSDLSILPIDEENLPDEESVTL